MRRFVWQFCAPVLAVAVLVVGATCTSAGCLLMMATTKASPQRHSCCAKNNSPDTDPAGRSKQNDKPCPVCGVALFPAGTTTNSTTPSTHTIVASALLNLDVLVEGLSPSL